MILRAIGTGSPFARHPLVTPSFLIETAGTIVVIGCGPGIPAKLEQMGVAVGSVDMWMALHAGPDQIGGLGEVAAVLNERLPRPYFAAPRELVETTRQHLLHAHSVYLDYHFSVQSTRKLQIDEEHYSDELQFVPNYWRDDSFGLVLEQTGVFITGHAPLNEDWLHRYGSPARVILHVCTIDGAPRLGKPVSTLPELERLPLYLQQKIWLYGYHERPQALADPLPMMFLPQGHEVFVSGRKEPMIDKQQFIRKASKRMLGDQSAQP